MCCKAQEENRRLSKFCVRIRVKPILELDGIMGNTYRALFEKKYERV